jgi:GNAT superfamily N-acetyltransferase
MGLLARRSCRIDFDPSDEFPTAHLYFEGRVVGHAHIKLHDTTAVLVDIVVVESLPNRNPLLAFLGFRTHLRNRGIGSILLEQLCIRLALLGIREISGVMEGDVDRLAKWYGRNGFAIDQGSRVITKRLNPDLMGCSVGTNVTAAQSSVHE